VFAFGARSELQQFSLLSLELSTRITKRTGRVENASRFLLRPIKHGSNSVFREILIAW